MTDKFAIMFYVLAGMLIGSGAILSLNYYQNSSGEWGFIGTLFGLGCLMIFSPIGPASIFMNEIPKSKDVS